MSFVTERLDAAIEQDVEPRNRDTWSIETMDQAAWASRKLRDAHAEIDEIDAWQTREIDRIKNAATAERNRIQQSAGFFENALAVYLNGLIKDGRKTKSLDLPGGKISIRARADKLEIDDEKAAVAWLKANCTVEDVERFVRVKEEIAKSALRDFLKRDGSRTLLVNLDPKHPVEDEISWARLEPQSDSVIFKPATDEDGGEESAA